MPCCAYLVVRVLGKQAAHLNCPDCHVQACVDRQNNIGKPVDKVENCVPVEIGVVPAELSGELLHCAQQARYEEAQNPTVGPNRIHLVLSSCELHDRNHNE